MAAGMFRESSRIEIVSLMDNTVDFGSSSRNPVVKTLWKWLREQHSEDGGSAQVHRLMPIAEHGFSMLIRVFTNDAVYRSILFDTGVSSEGILVNAQRMGLDLREVSVVVLSHGHYDHFGGLQAAVKAIDKPDLPLITHEYMFKPHGTDGPYGVRAHPIFPTPEQLSPAKIINTKEPCLIANQSVLVTGEISRKTSFERGCGLNRVLKDNIWEPDRWVLDDRALVINLKGRGLVIISGCAHAGLINTIRYAQEVTGIKTVYGVIGGFHLGGLENEKLIPQTLVELKQINPQLIVPCHCTGWRANYALAELFPQAYIHNSVGNLYQLNGIEEL
jgi:7,8-dihydropterin-6-yl-methyl-4-(beta-D-ribofuranosyl)aminobenzene 5'-phosphate synthase